MEGEGGIAKKSTLCTYAFDNVEHSGRLLS